MSEKLPRVLIVVTDGVADYYCDKGVDVEIFDWDNYKDDPVATAGVSESFRDLIEGTGIPIGDTLEERFPLENWMEEVANHGTQRSYQEWAEAKAEESSHA